MIHISNSFLNIIQVPADGTRPSRTSQGISFTAGASNSESSYVQILDGTTWPTGYGDGYGIYLEVANTFLTANTHAMLATIGIDPTGGTSYTEWINDLAIGQSNNFANCAISYYFPVRIPEGSSLAIKAQCDNASPVANSDLFFKIYCTPTRPELVRAGTFVRTFGANTGTSQGTSFTPGTTSEGAYTSLGTLSDTLWYWEYGVSINNTTITANVLHVDIAIGDGSSNRRVIPNALLFTGTSETVSKTSNPFGHGTGVSGDGVYIRGQVGENALISGYNAIAYGVGG